MKITKERLNKIIKEEIEAALSEKNTISELFGFGKKPSSDEVYRALAAAHKEGNTSKITKLEKQYKKIHKGLGTKIEDVNKTLYNLEQSRGKSGEQKASAGDAGPLPGEPGYTAQNTRKYRKYWDPEDMAAWSKRDAETKKQAGLKAQRLGQISANHQG